MCFVWLGSGEVYRQYSRENDRHLTRCQRQNSRRKIISNEPALKQNSFFRKFGITEVEDTLDFLEKISQYHYVDDARMAIWGWSYGGTL